MMHRTVSPATARLARGAIVLGLSGLYFAWLCQLWRPVFWTSGLGDWQDPYFINVLLEHWRHSLLTVTDPASPPMFFPAVGTLGYSHGLILYAPVYVAARLLFDVFQAYNVTVLVVLVGGTIGLYALLRQALRLPFLEVLLLTALFVTSPNITNGWIGVWSQRASVFLVPIIVWLVLASLRRRPGHTRVVLAGLSGLCSTLLFTQDFHTAQFALLLMVAGAGPVVLIEHRTTLAGAIGDWWRESTWPVRAATIAALVSFAWTLVVLAFGGLSAQVLGARIASRDWRRPALLAGVATALSMALRRASRRGPARLVTRSWFLPFAVGALAGVGVFLWIYAGAWAEHHAFPEEQLLGSLIPVDPSRWTGAGGLLAGLAGYESLRPFLLVLGMTGLAWIPRAGVDGATRWCCLWAALLSIVVLLIPVRLSAFSIWQTLVEPLPGFSALRDPKRIIYVYELVVVLGAGAFLARAPGTTARVTVALFVLVLLVTGRSPVPFEYLRPNETYHRWVSAPLVVDPSCRSFYVTPASPAYTSRPGSTGTVYALDAMSIALRLSIPTLNGYSAWTPTGWALGDPHDPAYRTAVSGWIEQHHLTGVCTFDAETRSIRPYGPT